MSPPGNLDERTVFEWMAAAQFLIQRWEVPHPDAPDGIAIIGFDPSPKTFHIKGKGAPGSERGYRIDGG